MSLIAKFDGNLNVIGRLLKEYRMKKIYFMKSFLKN